MSHRRVMGSTIISNSSNHRSNRPCAIARTPRVTTLWMLPHGSGHLAALRLKFVLRWTGRASWRWGVPAHAAGA